MLPAMNLPDPLHPALVHFPIAFLLLGTVMTICSLFVPGVALRRITAVVLILAALGAAAASWSGEEDEDAAEHAGPAAQQVLEEHEEWGERSRNAAIVTALAAGLAAFTASQSPRFSKITMIVTAALSLISSWCVIRAAHCGGELVYRHGVGVKTGADAKHARHGDE
jgi:uncharacterized membrane protein